MRWLRFHESDVWRSLGAPVRSADRASGAVVTRGYPENSLGAFQAASAADYNVELDVQVERRR